MDRPAIYSFEISSPCEFVQHPCSIVCSDPFNEPMSHQQFLCQQDFLSSSPNMIYINGDYYFKNIISFNAPCSSSPSFIGAHPKYDLDIKPSFLFQEKVCKHIKCSSEKSVLNPSLIPKKEKAKKTSITETLNMKDAVQEMERKIGQKLSLNYFCEKFNIKRRVLFDFLSIMNGLHICTRYSNEEFQWNGTKLDYTLLSKIKKNSKQDNRPIRQIFICNDKIGLNFVCFNLISLFIYLNCSVLDLKKVAKLFAPSGPALRTMLRKMYTISSSLETIGFISRTGKPAEIKLSEIFFKSTANDVAISSLLNSYNEDEIIYDRRRKEFDSL